MTCELFSRRSFIKAIAAGGCLFATRTHASVRKPATRNPQPATRNLEPVTSNLKPVTRNLQPETVLFRSVNGSPSENISEVIGLMGGTEKFFGPDDIVLIKPNVQWWNQGAPNLAALKAFVDLIMERVGGFTGEVVIAENCHRGGSPWTSMSSGWAHGFEKNSDLPNVPNFNELSRILKNRYKHRFSTCHLIDVGAGNKRVFGPWDGTGYVYCDGSNGVPSLTCENGGNGPNRRVTVMTYPIIRTDKGTIIDFKNGVWERGSYTGQPLRLINFSALNYHSTFCGLTSSIKNYMGIADLSGGSDPQNGGRLTKEFFNFHSFSFDWSSPGPVPGVLGAAIGTFMKTVRKADMNITTAEWVGLSSRTDPPVARARAVVASSDPVALDYHAAKYILFPNSKLAIHDPDNRKGPLYPYLAKCAEAAGGMLEESKGKVKSYDYAKKRLQRGDELVVSVPVEWGTNPKAILKYLALRYWI